MPKRAARRRKRRKRDAVKTVSTERTAIGRPMILLGLGGLLIAGVITRVQFLERSLWLDEAWVANSIRAASLHQAIYYDAWLQTTPPLFIALSRVITTLFGTSNAAFRALPVFSGIISVMLFSFLAVRLLKPCFALIATLLFVFSPRLILYSQSVKQYSTDVLSTVALLLLGHLYLEKHSERSFYVLLAGFVALSFLSYSAMLFLPFTLYSAIIQSNLQSQANDTRKPIHPNRSRLASVVVLGVVVYVTNYLVFIAPNKNSALTEFFADGFYQGHTPASFLEFYGTRLLTLTAMFFFGGSPVLRLVTVFIAAVGFVYLWIFQTKLTRLERFQAAVLLTTPVVGVIALNMAGFFPLPGFHHRLLVFAFPLTVLLFCFGLQFIASLTSRYIASRFERIKPTSVENVLGGIVFAGLLGLAALFFVTVGLKPYFAEEHEDSEQAVAYLRQHLQPDDVLYVHATMREQFKLYGGTSLPIATTRVVYGKIGVPCCPRREYRSPQQESAEDIDREIFALSDAAKGRSLWLLITNRSLAWVHLQRNDIHLFERGLAGQGCNKSEQAKFMGVYVARFGCQPK